MKIETLKAGAGAGVRSTMSENIGITTTLPWDYQHRDHSRNVCAPYSCVSSSGESF